MPCATAPLLQTESPPDVEEEQPKDSAEVQTSAPRPGSAAYVPLLAVTALPVVLLLRFRYHFDSSRPSNRLDKLEWYLSHILGLVRAYGLESDLFRPGTGSVARLCALGGWGRAHGVVPSKTSKGNGIPEKMLDTGAELLHELLVPLRAKLIASMPLLLPHPPLLAHTISEYIILDDALRTTYPPSNLSQPDTARGPALSLADQVLNNSDWFAAWLAGERAHAEERLYEILNAGDAWAIRAADGVEDEEDALVGGGRAGEEMASGPVQRFPTQSTTKGAQESTNATGSRTAVAASIPTGGNLDWSTDGAAGQDWSAALDEGAEAAGTWELILSSTDVCIPHHTPTCPPTPSSKPNTSYVWPQLFRLYVS